MKKITYIIAFILTLSSCEKEVNIPIEYTKPKLVINALFNTDSLWSIEVSESQYIYDTITLPLIDNAEVSITDSDNNTITLTNQGEGIYTSASEKPVIGKEYTLNVTHGVHENVKAKSKLPDQLIINSINWDNPVYVDGDLYRKINVSFKDTPEDDYYLITLSGDFYAIEKDEFGNMDTTLENYAVYFSTQNAAVDNPDDYMYQSSISFTDGLFNGTDYTIDLLISDYYFGSEDGKDQMDALQKIFISFSRISQEYYWYETSYQAYLNSQWSFAQPVQVYTNIENGLGVFAGFSTMMDSINIQN